MTIFAKKISGKVQGIGFRATAVRIATEMSLNGFVKNLDNGDVEIVIEGSKQQFDLLMQNIHQAIPSLQITNIEEMPVPKHVKTGFTMD